MALVLMVNGQQEEVEVAAGASLAEVISAMGLKGDRVAVERNGQIVARAAWTTEIMDAGDKLEVVHFVGGG